MDFSELFRTSGPVRFSPDGRMVAAAVGHRLAIRDTDTLQMVQLYSCADTIKRVEWSPNAKYILCAMPKQALVQVWSLEDPAWTCRIDEGAAGLVHSRWSPDGMHVINTADFRLRLSVWSLVRKAVEYIKFPKTNGDGLAFDSKGKYFAVAERSDHRDSVHIYSCENYQRVHSFQTDTMDLASLRWSPDDSTLMVFDCSLQYRALFYTSDGRLLAKYEAYENALGLRTGSFAPSGKLVALGSYDDRARLLNAINFRPVAELLHTHKVTSNDVVVYVETEAELPTASGLDPSSAAPTASKYEIADVPFALPYVKPSTDKPNPKMGISSCLWSPDSRILVSRCDAMTNCVFVWDANTLQLHSVLVHKNAVKDVCWHPQLNRLAICCGTRSLFMWSEDGAFCVDVPAGAFETNRVSWSAEGTSILLADRDKFCCAYSE